MTPGRPILPGPVPPPRAPGAAWRWAFATWLPPLLAVATAAAAASYASTAPAAPGPPAPHSWPLQLVLMSGNGLVLAWLSFVWWRARESGSGAWAGAKSAPAAALVTLVLTTFTGGMLADRRPDREAAAVVVWIYLPTLVFCFTVIASGLRRVQATRHAALLLAGFAGLGFAFQLGGGPIASETDFLRAVALNSVLIGTSVLVRLGIWGFTGEGLPSRARG